MLTERVLTLLRRKLSESDLAISNLTDSEILEFMGDALEELSLRGVAGMSALAIGTQVDEPGYGIVPEPTTEQAHMLALKTSSIILRNEYMRRLLTGEIGSSWRSGLESESTINTDASFKKAIKEFEATLEELLLIKRAPTTGTRPQ